MSFVSFSNSIDRVTADELHSAAHAAGFDIPKGSQDEKDYLLLQNSFDAVVASVAALPEYVDPRLRATEVEGDRRTFITEKNDPLNAWSHKTSLRAKFPTSRKLAGKTIVVKDNISVAAAPLELGTSRKLFANKHHPVSTIDATVVKRILAAGGTIEGTAICENMSLFAISLTADTGPVHNAWAPGYTTGGSSSGCAALVSARDVKQWKNEGRSLPFPDNEAAVEPGVDMAVGGDQGGSIRLPAHFSGIYGLKATHGLIPYTGVASLLPMIDHIGPMARSVEDVALLLGVLAGYDGIDFRQTPETPLENAVPDYSTLLAAWKTSKEQAGEWTPQAAGKGLRIGVLIEAWQVVGMETSVGRLVRAAAERFKAIGAEVREVSVPIHLLGPSIWTVAGRAMMPSTLGNRAPDLLGHTLPGLDPLPVDQAFYDYMAHRNPAVVNVLLNAAHLEAKYGPSITRKAHMHVSQMIAAYDRAFEGVDILLTPVTGSVAIKIPEGITKDGSEGSTLGAMELALTQLGATLNTCPFNASGHPAMSVPIGWLPSKDRKGKLPVGMQLVAKRWGEMDIFKAATAWEILGKGLDS